MNKDPEDRLVKGQRCKNLSSAHPAVYDSTGILILIEAVIIWFI